MSGIDAAAIRAVLRQHGIEFLAANDDRPDHAEGPQVVVFLHGYAGTSRQMDAMDLLREMDGVSSVEVSSVSWTILIVRFEIDLGERA